MAAGETVAAPDVRQICIEENQASLGVWKKAGDVDWQAPPPARGESKVDAEPA